VTFAPGDTVRVSERPHDGHHRTPGYLKGREGTVARAHGRFRNPETRAYGGDGLPEHDLYLVSFDLDGDRVLADLLEHWLEAG
jgi:Nitrile hydratase beta subunit, C-terminal